MRNFILVTATIWKMGSPVISGRGIRKLKRGETLSSFIDTYLNDEFSITSDMYKRWEREGTICISANAPPVHWTFTQYPESELLFAVSHLSKEELLRDLKELLPLKVELT